MNRENDEYKENDDCCDENKNKEEQELNNIRRLTHIVQINSNEDELVKKQKQEQKQKQKQEQDREMTAIMLLLAIAFVFFSFWIIRTKKEDTERLASSCFHNIF